MTTFSEELAGEFRPYFELSSEQLARLQNHYDLMVRWNAKINLTRIVEQSEAIRLHYCESLIVGLRLPSGPLKIADLGSGAGFPGFPIAVLRPEVTVDLIESDQRKAAFLREASRGIGNLSVIAKRAGEVDRKYDWVVSRAVQPTEVEKSGLSRNFAVLTSGEQGELLPWGKNRRLLVFHVEQKI